MLASACSLEGDEVLHGLNFLRLPGFGLASTRFGETETGDVSERRSAARAEASKEPILRLAIFQDGTIRAEAREGSASSRVTGRDNAPGPFKGRVFEFEGEPLFG